MDKLYILIDDENTIQCVTFTEAWLHKDKIEAGMKTYVLSSDEYKEKIYSTFPGDKFDPKTGEIVSRPENHAPLPDEMINMIKIQDELNIMAAERLIAKKELPDDFISKYLAKKGESK